VIHAGPCRESPSARTGYWFGPRIRHRSRLPRQHQHDTRRYPVFAIRICRGTDWTVGRPADRPAWSPDGAKIAFVSQRDENYEIYVMNADGSEKKRLTNDANDNGRFWGRFSWSPDGEKIAFESARYGDPNSEIYVMNTDGGGNKTLTSNSDYDGGPSWSPDGKKIAFESHRDRNPEIYVMNADGTEQKRLTDLPSDDRCPSWSPDGRKIAFESYVRRKIAPESYVTGTCEIYVMNENGSEQKNLTKNQIMDTGASWSPDGKKITFASYSDEDEYWEIYVVNANGSGQKKLIGKSNSERPFHYWSPFITSEREVKE